MSNGIIYHYCDLQTAISILKNRELWMTNVRNMNDGNESVGIYQLIFKMLQNEFSCDNPIYSFLEFAQAHPVIRMCTRPMGEEAEHAACFSENSDLVSQWVSYANNGKGLAIGFDASEIERVCHIEPLKYKSVEYVSEENIRPHIKKFYEFLMGNFGESEFDNMFEVMKIILSVFPANNCYKTTHYRNEQEKRIVYDYPSEVKGLPEGWEIGERSVYAKENLINTYVPLKFSKGIIKEVIAGPKYQRNCCELEFAMGALGYIGVSIKQSTSGYR